MRRACLRLSLSLATACAADGAFAQAAIVDGSYGDAEGCRYGATGRLPDTDIYMLLTPDRVTSTASECIFVGQGRQIGGATVIDADCSEEGYEETKTLELTLTPDSAGFTIRLPDGTRWGPLMRCGT